MLEKEITQRIQQTDNLNRVAYVDNKGPGGAYHKYSIHREYLGVVPEPLLKIQFQEGARNEEGSIAGVLEVDLLEVVRHRLQCFQQGDYPCRENACALTHIEEALMWMNKRVQDRKARGVLGKHEK